MTTDPFKLLALYDRGILSSGTFEIGLVQAATETDPAEFAPLIPPDVLSGIREKAAAPEDTKWMIATLGCFERNPTPEQVQASQQQKESDLQMWRDGLDRWREYFKGLGT